MKYVYMSKRKKEKKREEGFLGDNELYKYL